MACTVTARIAIEPTEDKWINYVRGDPSSIGLSAGQGSVAIKAPDFTVNPNDKLVTYIKTGSGDTDWTPQDAIVT